MNGEREDKESEKGIKKKLIWSGFEKHSEGVLGCK